MNENSLPLEGIKVLELASVIAAPTAGRIMAAYGAEVIKVEVLKGDELRTTGSSHGLPQDDGNMPLFDVFNSGKKFIAVNMKDPKGKEVIFKLLDEVDIVFSNIRYQSLERMGLAYEQLCDRFPKLVYAHFSGYGPEGEEKNRPGYDIMTYWARGGALADGVEAGTYPFRPSFGFGDVSTGSLLLNGILMALISRERTGKGRKCMVSLIGSGVWCGSTYVINSQEPYNIPHPETVYDSKSPFQPFYMAKDGRWMSIYLKDQKDVNPIIADVFDMPELLTDPDLATEETMAASGKKNQIIDRLKEKFREKTTAEWAEALGKYGVLTTKISKYEDVCKDPQILANGYLQKTRYPGADHIMMPVPPIAYNDCEQVPFEKAGLIGSDTDSVLKSLGYSEEEIRQMRENRSVR